MNLSIVIPWQDCGDPCRNASWRWLRRRYDLLFQDAEIFCGGGGLQPPFNRAAARNFLVGQTSRDVLLIADADTVFNTGQIYRGLDSIAGGASWVIPYSLGRYYNLSRQASSATRNCAPDVDIPEPSNPAEWEHKIDSWAGLLLLRRAAFDTIGGYDERFTGWGYEDNAFRAALDHHVGPHARVDGYALHLWHPAPEADCFGQPHIAENRALCQQYEQGLLP